MQWGLREPALSNRSLSRAAARAAAPMVIDGSLSSVHYTEHEGRRNAGKRAPRESEPPRTDDGIYQPGAKE